MGADAKTGRGWHRGAWWALAATIIAALLVLGSCSQVADRVQGCGRGEDLPATAAMHYVEEVAQRQGSGCSMVKIGSGWSKDDPEVVALNERIQKLDSYYVSGGGVSSKGPYLVMDDVTGEHVMTFFMTESAGNWTIDWKESMALYEAGPTPYITKLGKALREASR